MRALQNHHLRIWLYTGAAAAALAAAPALAQTTPVASAGADKAIVLAQAGGQNAIAPTAATAPAGTSVEELQVYGIKRSQISAQRIKKANEDIVEVVTAEEIGKLPEESIADSIARLPGLASQRDNSGRWQDISVNGLPPAMSTTLFNGFLQATTDNNRVTQFDQYPAEILNSVVVYKTGDAALTGAAIATVDMRTIRPLDYGKTTIAIGAQGEYDTRGALQPGADALGYRVNATAITQFDDDKIGVMVGYTHMLAPNQIYAQHPYGFNEPFDVVSGLQDQVRSDDLTRDAFVGTVQWKPTDKLEFTLDGFTSSYDDNAIIRGVEIQTACCGNATQVGTPTQGQSSWIVAPQLQNYDYDEKARLRSVDFTAKYELAPGWNLKADYGYSDAKRDNSRIELYSGFGTDGEMNHSTATLTAGAGQGGMIGISNWSENLSDPASIALGENLGWQQGWWPSIWPGGNVNGMNIGSMFGSAYFQHIHSDDVIQQADGALSHAMSGPISNIEVGLSYSTRKKNFIDHEGIGALTSGNEAQTIPADWLLAPTNLSAFGLPSLFSIDPVKAWASGAYAYLERPDELDHDWWVSEHVLTPYIEAKINAAVAGRPLTGNIGVQFVHTDQNVTTFAQTGGWPNLTFIPFGVNAKYWDILPSLNLTWHLTDNQDLRLGAGRSMARPRFDQMGGNTSFNYDSTKAGCTDVKLGCSPWSGSLANPTLKPWVSDDVDVTYDYYFAPGEGVSVEGFYKNLETFIYNSTTIGDFTAIYNAGQFSPRPNIFVGPVSQFVNGNGGSIYGLVVSANVSLKHLWSELDGFGVSATGTALDSSVQIPDPGTSPTGRIPEMSRYIFNAMFYYEKYGFSFRINDRFRSSYVQEVPNFDGSLQAIEGAKENTVDVQLGYQFQQGRYKGLSVSFSAENITDTPMNSFLGGNPSHPEYYKLFGTNLLFGVSYRY